MTTIAYRAGVMVSDSRAYFGDGAPIGSGIKIFNTNGILYGASAGATGVARAICDWFRDTGGDVEKAPERITDPFAFLAVNPNGTARFMCEEWCWRPISAEFYAIGSGMKYALGAMEAGANAKMAVEIAEKCDVWTQRPFFALLHSEVDKRLEIP